MREIQHQEDSELVALKMEGPFGKELRMACRNREQSLTDTSKHRRCIHPTVRVSMAADSSTASPENHVV